jgi:BolA protein
MSTGPIESQIINTLSTSMNLSSLKITNESFMHNVPKGSESHFKIIVVTNDFNNLSIIKRHKLIYKTLDNLMNKIHALSIHAFNEEEFKLNPIILDSPECANK